MQNMKETPKEKIEELLNLQRGFFNTNRTKDISFRREQLKKFKKAIVKYEVEIADALWKDLHKTSKEAYLTEIGIVISEIKNHIKHLKKWSKDKKVCSPLFLLPSRSKIIHEPLGVALIITPWNYPFQLLMNPLVGAISAGCCAVLKTSPNVPNVNDVMERLIKETFPENYISITHGHRGTNKILLDMRFDIIFFTGSPFLGKIVMEAAARNLTPVVLELGGKSPCIVDKGANLKAAAKRIMWGKTINAGQTCIAPDYLFAHKEIKDALFEQMKVALKQFFGENPKLSEYYPRIVSHDAMKRLQNLMKHGNIVVGGEVDEAEKYIAPTIIDGVQPDSPIMQEEIFGPILPVMSFDKIDKVVDYVNSHEKPLAFYYFGKNKQAKDILRKTSSGGGCINDTLMHITNHNMPFGGVGNSGMGRYHGLDSFLSFSHQRSIVTTPTFIDLPMKYAPFNFFKLIKKIL